MGRAAAGRVTVSHFLLRSPPAIRVAVVEDSTARAPPLHGQAPLLAALPAAEELELSVLKLSQPPQSTASTSTPPGFTSSGFLSLPSPAILPLRRYG